MPRDSSPLSALTPGQNIDMFRLLVASVKDYAIFMLDPDGCIISWNAGAERIKGYTAKEAIGKHFSIFYERKSALAGHPEHELAVAQKEGRYEEEGWRVRKDGTRFWANVVITALVGENGENVGFAKVTRDLTERRKADQRINRVNSDLERRVELRTAQLRESNDRITALNDRLRRAIRETHHRVRNNLQIIIAMIDSQIAEHAASREIPPSELDRLKRHVATLAAAHQLFTHRQLTEDRDTMMPLDSILGALLPLLQETLVGLRLTYHIEDFELPVKQCVGLGLIINELVTNSVKNGATDSKVTLTHSGFSSELVVDDNGAGFPPDFSPDQDTHCGLDLVKSVVRTDLAGEISFDTAPGRGARVRISFPSPVPLEAEGQTTSA